MIGIAVEKKLKSAGGEMLLSFDTTIPSGQLVTLFGESGAGKTSILRMIAGLLDPDYGRIEVDEELWFDKAQKINVKPQKRSIGFVFQDYALFPNMTVKENLLYAAGNNNLSYISELIEIIEIGNLENRKPDTLSGGQKQRVALARALVRHPKVLMLDEPLSALDYQMRRKLQDYILKVHRQLNLTTILVSHEPAEIFKMSDQVIQLENGGIEKIGSPFEIFSRSKISGKYQLTGEIINIENEEVVFIVSVMIGNDMVKVITDKNEIANFKIGSKVVVSTKAFNPFIQKIVD